MFRALLLLIFVAAAPVAHAAPPWDEYACCGPGKPIGLSLTNTTYAASTKGTVVGRIVLSGLDTVASTFALSGPDSARFQLSTPCTPAWCTLQASGSEPDGFHDGLFHIFITPTLTGVRGTGIAYPFEIAETVVCNNIQATGFTQATLATAIALASGTTQFNICLQGTGTFTSGVTVNKNNVRITGVNSVAAPTAAWYSAAPNITVTGQITAFAVSGDPVTIDHVKATGALVVDTSDSCLSLSNFVHDTATLPAFAVRYNQTSTFMCDYWLVNTSSITASYNSMTGSGFLGIVCDPCSTSTWSNNQFYNPTDEHEPNDYPFVVSGDANSTSVTMTNNSVFNPMWECYDSHGSTDTHIISNYCVGGARIAFMSSANAGINIPGNSGITAVRPWITSNFIDRGAAADSGTNTIVEVAGSGGTLTCGTVGAGTDCRVTNNTLLFGALDNVGCGLFATGAGGGTLTGTQTISGNTCGGAMATMAAPTITTDQPSSQFVAGQPNGVIGKIGVVMTPAFPAWVGGWPNYGGWPGTFSIGGTDAAQFQICADGQHVCQRSSGTNPGTWHITLTGTLSGLNNSPQTSGTLTLTGT